MKIKSLLVGIMACVALTACTNEDLVENNANGGNTSPAKAYIGIKIADPLNGAGLRAATDGDFANGTEAEHSINKSLFLFYNSDGSYAGEGYHNGAIGTTSTEGDTSIEANSTVVVVLKGKQDETAKYPDQVVAYLNLPKAVEDELKDKSLDKAMRTVANISDIPDYAKGGSFIMTNSTYLNGDNVICATAIDPKSFVQTEEVAKASPVIIHVERLASKVVMNKAENMSTSDIDIKHQKGTYKKMKLVIDGWGINGVNKSSYLLKNIDATWKNSEDFKWDWNAAGLYRSYWAKDANHSNVTYPSNYEAYTGKENDSPLEYRSWNDIVSTKYAAQYCPENTMDATAASNINATTYMVIAGHYEFVDPNNDNNTIPIKGKLYKYIDTYYAEDDMLDRLANQAGLYTLSEEGDKETWKKADASHYQLGRASLYDAKLELKNDESNYYAVKGDKTSKYESKEAANAALLKKLGTITTFADGKTFFYVNIEHLNTTEGQEGHIGIVRNHVYELTLNKIENLGHGVFDPDEDIIITPKEKEFYVAATLKILSWKVVKQGVDL